VIQGKLEAYGSVVYLQLARTTLLLDVQFLRLANEIAELDEVYVRVLRKAMLEGLWDPGLSQYDRLSLPELIEIPAQVEFLRLHKSRCLRPRPCSR